MSLLLEWRGVTSDRVEAECLRPDALVGETPVAIAHREVAVGNTRAQLGDFFDVTGDSSESHVRIVGNLGHVARIGQGMTSGALVIEGDVGAHLGAGMTGGSIMVLGSAGDWAGAEMRGGLLFVRGDTGHYLGAAYPGSRAGMREGVILVLGQTGHDAGLSMRRGLIAVRGTMGDTPGRAMIAGSLFCFGDVGMAPGIGMKRGSIVLFGAQGNVNTVSAIAPTFVPTGNDRFTFVAVYLRQLHAWGFPVPERACSTSFDKYNGDLAVGGQGEILLALRS